MRFHELRKEGTGIMLATALVSGLSLGSIYGLIALGFTLTFAVSGTVNFAQGSSVMLGAVICHVLAVGLRWPMASTWQITVPSITEEPCAKFTVPDTANVKVKPSAMSP